MMKELVARGQLGSRNVVVAVVETLLWFYCFTVFLDTSTVLAGIFIQKM